MPSSPLRKGFFDVSGFNSNQEVFFTLLRAGLWGKADANLNAFLNLNEKVEWDKVYQFAQEQAVQGIALHGIERLKRQNDRLDIPQVLLLQWIGEVQVIEQKNRAMTSFVSVLIEKLRKEDVYTILVKGQGIAQCYEKPLWRSCGDVDLLLNKDNYEKAKSFLIPISSTFGVEEKNGKHIGLTLAGWSVELHGTQHGELSDRIDGVIDEVQQDVLCGVNVRLWDNSGTTIFLPAPDNDVIFIFTHFIKHYFKEGVGLRQICDWCRLLYTYKDSLNRGLLEKRIQKARLMSEWKAFAALAVNYLGMPINAMPLYSAEVKWQRKAKRICDYILEVGNFGHNRNVTYFEKYPYIVRKSISFWRRTGYLFRHASVFPWDSLRFFPSLVFNGVRSALRGE